jgi:hypothetical protein
MRIMTLTRKPRAHLSVFRRKRFAPPSGILRGKLQDFSGSKSMLDVVMLAIGFAFFAVSVAYVYACDRL